MATKAALSEAEYLQTSFLGVDQEFHDGELVERSVPDLNHGLIQMNLGGWFTPRRNTHQLYAASELRLHARAGKFLIPDVCVFWPRKPARKVPQESPLIAIEILFEDDRMAAILEKLREYKDLGVVHVWLIDPSSKTLYEYQGGLHEVTAFRIPEVSLEITHADIFDSVDSAG